MSPGSQSPVTIKVSPANHDTASCELTRIDIYGYCPNLASRKETNYIYKHGCLSIYLDAVRGRMLVNFRLALNALASGGFLDFPELPRLRETKTWV